MNGAVFETPVGVQPRVKVKVKNRDPATGLVEFSVEVDRATLPQGPVLCGGGPPPATQLRTGFTLDDGFNLPVSVATSQPWRCKGDQLKTP